MWMANILKKDWAKMAHTVEAESKDLLSLLEERLSGLSIRRIHLFESLRRSGLNGDKPTFWSDADFLNFVDTLRQVAKPMLIVANKMDMPPSKMNLERLKEANRMVIPCCAEAELALRRAAEKGLIDYKPGDCNFKVNKPETLSQSQTNALEIIREKILLGLGSTGVQEAINNAYFRLLNMITVYPVEDLEHLSDHLGRVLPDSYLVPYGTTARQLAYIIHTELGQGFIYAVEAREKKRVGENYILKDRDVISIVSARKRA
jgi:ribosome-binding ATPase YchF (GTP1/OBG family)